jgi:hypothetical protein
MNSPVKTTVILDRPSDWDEWLFLVKSKANDSDIWQYIDLNKLAEPQSLLDPIKPKASDVNAAATSVIALTPQEQSTFKLLHDEYRTELIIYERKRAALRDIKNYILTTIARQNLSFVIDQQTPYQMLTALKKRIAPTDRARKLDLARHYQDLGKAPRAQEQDKWLQSWEKIYTDAKLLELPEVLGEKSLYDFLLAIKGSDPSFADIQKMLLEDKIKENRALPTVYDLIESYRNHIRVSRATTKASSHTVFATFQDKPPSPSIKGLPGSCVCGETHFYGQCL